MYYLACNECKKKVMEEGVGFRCETCNKVMTTCNVNYTLTVIFED